MAAWFQRRGRAALSPAAARNLILMNSKVDVRGVLPSVHCPTLVLHRSGDLDSQVASARAGEVLVTGTTRDLVEGSGLRFEDRGDHELKGIEGARTLFAAV
jgi:pimeloyl-ACP methyl ester carboxylesterase